MDIINDRYRIIKFIKQNRVSMSYIVQDLRRQYGVMQLNIINSERIPNSLINYYMKEFITLTNIESSKINKVYEFGVINLVDKKKFNDTKYYYTNEYLEHKYDLKNLIKDLKEEKEVLDLFVEICKSVNYLHLKGFAYGGVNLNNIWFNKNNHELNIKLKDIATVKLERYNRWTNEENNSLFKYFMSNKQEKTSMMYDIYSLGVLLFTICMENYEKYTNFNQILSQKSDIVLKIKDDFSETFRKKISEIIIKCTESNVEKGYKNIYEIIKDINCKFNKNYESQDIEEINKINFNLKLIGREQEVNKVLEEYDSILENSYEDKIVLIHGEAGIGKTKLLKTIKDLLIYKKANVYFNFSSNNKSNQLFKEIFKQIIRQCDSYLLDKYEKEIVNILREVSLNKELNTCNKIYSNNEKLKTLNRVQRFMNELTKYQPIVLIIDDIYLADELSIELLEYLCNREVVNKSILLILSYSEGKHVLNKRILELIENIKFRKNVLNLSINGLTQEQTGIMIQNILSMRKRPKNFSNKIYSKSYGNPLFIEEIIKDFFSKKIIYVDKDTACWCTDYDYDDFPIPTDINQLLLNQIDEINNFDHEILSTIATFINPISIETISYINACCKEKIDKHIHSMLDRGVLCKKIGDQGFVYDFYNKLLKDMIYQDMNKNKKKERHKLAADFLEKQFNNGHKEYIEELIYHLEKSEQNDKVIDYCLENSIRMKKLHNNIEAIKNLKKAIESIKYNCKLRDKEINLLIDIGNLYKELGDFKEALYYFEEAENKAGKLNQCQLQISCLNNIASIYFDKNNIDKTKNYLEKISLIINKNKNIEQYFKFNILKARLYNVEKKYNEAYEICLKCVKMCEEGYKKYKAIFYNIVSNIYISTSQREKAEYVLNKSINICNEIKYYKGLVIALNNMGVIYSDYAEDRDKALEYYKQVNEICKKYNNMIVSEVVALTNIGETYFYNQDYQLSLKYFQETKEKAKKGDFEASVFYAYTFLCRIHLRLGNYKSAYEYYQLCNIELDSYPLHGREIGEYYMACAELNLEFADLQEAHKFAYKAFKSYEKEESVLKLNSEFLLNYIKLVNDFDDNFPKYIGKINKIIDNISYVGNKVRLLYKLSRFLYYKGYLEQGKKILDKIDNLFNNEYKSNYIKINMMYLKALYSEDNKIQALSGVLELVKRSYNYRLEGEIYAEIGQCYFNNKEYVYSFIYYFECCQRLVNLIEQLPGKCVFNVINIYNIKEPFRRLNMLKQHYCESKFLKSIDEGVMDRYKFKYDNMEDIKNIVNCKNVFENKYFMREIRKVQGILSHNKINDIRKLLNNLISNNIENLQLILQYVLYLTMGTEGYIITKQNNEYVCIASSNKDRQISNEDFKVIDKVNETKQPLLISNLSSYENIEYFNKNIRGCICVPIIIKKSLEKNYITERRTKNSYSNSRLIGYLYIKTERALNNFTEKSLKKCMQLNGLIGIIIEKYKLKIIASFDKLTGTLTRKYLEEAIEENIDLSSDNEEKFSMIMFDLDHFKKVNDRFGHQTGDEVLKRVCEVIRDNIRSTDVCGRYGGEEFIIILKNTNVKYASKIAEKLRKKVENAKILGDKEDVTISMGIVSYPEHGQWKQQLIEKIDQALYMAKESGRNQCKVWNKDFSNKAKGTDKLTGIITENEVQNNRNVLVMVELLDLVNQNISFEQKIYKILGRIIEITEAQYGILFKIKDGLIEKTFSRKNFNEDWITMPIYDENILKSVINKKQGVYMIDWDNIIKKDSLMKTPDWHSVIAVPITKKEKISAILYLSVSVKMKEFTFKEFNFVNTLSKIINMIL